jgi:hypothetical protein
MKFSCQSRLQDLSVLSLLYGSARDASKLEAFCCAGSSASLRSKLPSIVISEFCSLGIMVCY